MQTAVRTTRANLTRALSTMRAVQIPHTCDADELAASEDVPVPELANGQVLVQNVVTGLNFIDTYYRTGLYPVSFPFTLGVEGAGVITDVAKDLPDHLLGTRVGYFGGSGSYAEFTAVNLDQSYVIPEYISMADAVCASTQGLTAHYLTNSTYPLKQGDTCLVQAAGGGTGQLVVAMAKIRGARVIGTASCEEKIQVAKAAGADEMINYSSENVAERVAELTDGNGVNVVFDGVGKSTWETSLNVLRRRGTCVYFGNASGPVPAIDPLMLTAKGSVFITRPRLHDYIQTKEELQGRIDDIFSWVRDGKLTFNLDRIFPLKDASQAHEYIEGGKTKGKVIIEVRDR